MKIKNKEGKVIFDGADLYGANLRGADLRGANLYGIDLSGADLYCADLRDADLRGANLYVANLSGADLYGADLRGADLYGANLRGADLRDADLRGANLAPFQIVPQEGSFIAYKKINTGVITIQIPKDAKRASSLIGRKCRAAKVKMIEGKDGLSLHDRKTKYKKGKITKCGTFDDDIRVECAGGIHFFMTRKEAEEYN